MMNKRQLRNGCLKHLRSDVVAELFADYIDSLQLIYSCGGAGRDLLNTHNQKAELLASKRGSAHMFC